jgi:hypothetical protein
VVDDAKACDRQACTDALLTCKVVDPANEFYSVSRICGMPCNPPSNPSVRPDATRHVPHKPSPLQCDICVCGIVAFTAGHVFIHEAKRLVAMSNPVDGRK